ncbi:MAG: multiheme c-type cytochrome [Myxococcota bacterium]|nr:multiheme c-type cytochrome [Myxococcota bacterium]
MIAPLFLSALACNRAPGPSGSADDSPGPTDSEPTELTLELGLPAQEERSSAHFATAGVCAECHENAETATGMRDSLDQPIGQFDLWKATMMANSARDPLFRAVVSSEVARNPELQEDIEGTCLACHAPLGHQQAGFSGSAGPTLAGLYEGSDTIDALALDGVSCTLCHQIQPDGLGTEASFNAGYVIDPDAKEIYGPHADPFTRPMQNHTGFTPTEGQQILDAGHCGSCHTLYTHTVVDGEFTEGQLPEQTPFLEWQASFYGQEGVTCQSCHLPTTDAQGEIIETRIARNPHGGDFSIDERQPFGRHIFRGGNVFMLRLLRDNAEALQPRADQAAFDAQIEQELAFLGNASATLTLRAASEGVRVEVGNLGGHKLPSAHPARRAWLQIQVLDGAGEVLLASGLVDEQGRIVDGAGNVLALEQVGGAPLGHLERVESAEQVQIYQSLMLDTAGAWTWDLLAGSTYGKDNRLLPAGWDAARASELGVAPVGVDGDADFAGGGDSLLIALPEGAATVKVALVYQSVSPRYIAELAVTDTPEIRDFVAMAEADGNQPVVLAQAELAL